MVAWLGVPLKNFEWTGENPNTFESSKGVFRHFCGQCGSPIGFEADHYPGGMHLYAGSLENPSDFEPTFHVNYGSKLHWLNLEDEHQRYESTLANSNKDLADYD